MFVYRQYNCIKGSTSLQAYRALAHKPENLAPNIHERELSDPDAALHKKFWCVRLSLSLSVSLLWCVCPSLCLSVSLCLSL